MPRATSQAPERPEGSPFRFVSIDELDFDPDNPRLPSSIDGSNAADVLQWMLEDATLLELMASIGEQGYFEGEPLVVVAADGRLVTVEGNRRLAALRLLNDPTLAPVRDRAVADIVRNANHRPDRVPVIEAADRDSVLDYLGFRHITGVKEWEPLAKARYLRQLWDRSEGSRQERLRQLARKIGSRPDYVARLLRGLGLFDVIEDRSFFGIEELDEDRLSFSLLTTAVSFSNIVEFLELPDEAENTAEGVDVPRLEELTKWIYQPDDDGKTVLGDSRNLKTLAAVVGSPPAVEMLRSGLPLVDAAQFSEAPAASVLRNLRLAYRRLGAAQQVLPRLDDPPPAIGSTIDDIISRAEDMANAIERRERRARRSSRD